MRSSGDWIFRIFPFFFGFILFVIVTGWIVMGVVAYKSINAVNEKGLKGVAEQVWCGKENTDCKLPDLGSK